MHKSFPFWPFLHCRFSLSSHFARQSDGWVKIYNVKKGKTEMTCAPPKTYKNKKSFWIPSNQPPNTCIAGWAKFVHRKHVFVRHPSAYDICSTDPNTRCVGCNGGRRWILIINTTSMMVMNRHNVIHTWFTFHITQTTLICRYYLSIKLIYSTISVHFTAHLIIFTITIISI